MIKFSIILLLICFFKVYCAPWTVSRGELSNSRDRERRVNLNEDLTNYGRPYVDNDRREYDYDQEKADYEDDEPHTYMEKKIFEITKNGSIYLEGLRKALTKYTDDLQNCTRNKFNSSLTQDDIERCRKAVRDSERVKRIAQLAAWTTREIQDRDYYNTYQDSHEEKVLLLRLAWLLDRLAYMTGYEPKAEDFLTANASAPTPTANSIPNFMGVNITDDLKMNMINCLDRENNSTEPAYTRCPKETPLMPPHRTFVNSSNIPTWSNDTVPESSDTSTAQLSPSPTREKLSPQSIKDIFIKSNDREKELQNHAQNIDNGRLVRKPRDVESKETKAIAANPYQDISEYLSNNKGINFAKDEAAADRLRLYLKRAFRNSKVTLPRFDRTSQIDNTVRRRRAVYHRHEGRPISRVPEDPYQDLSFYVKSKEGVNVKNDAAEAARLRASLEAAFLNPSIETARRYGSNYNPLVPHTLYAGYAKSAADF